MRISYGRVQGSGYNARNGNNVALCPGGEKKKKKKKISDMTHCECLCLTGAVAPSFNS